MAATPRSPSFALLFSTTLLVSGFALVKGALSRSPAALQMLPSFDGCLATGIVGVLLALLHGVPYRAALFYIGVPVVAIQLAVTRAANVSFVSFVAMLGAELIAWGLFGLPHSRLPRRHRAPTRHRAPPRAQEIPS